MKILVIGSGGREHALCWRFHSENHEVFALPGSLGISRVARCVDGKVDDFSGILKVALEKKVDLVVVGPEVPLVDGLADQLRGAGVLVFGPSAKAAQLEGSKVFSKGFFKRHSIPTAEFLVCASMPEVDKALGKLGGRVVVKVDGLAAGKGVIVCSDVKEARKAAESMLCEGRFGQAGAQVLIERRLVGREVSMMAICDGKRYELLALAEDHKTIGNGDTGPNTGGMGTVSPPSWQSDALLERAKREIFDRTIAGLLAEEIDFRGVLYAGLMVEEDGTPWLLEYNVRFGDPETQSVLFRLQSDLGQWLKGAAEGQLPPGSMQWDDSVAICVILASEGYPAAYRKGDSIEGIETANAREGVHVFEAGTTDTKGTTVTSGGRVLGVSAKACDLASARRLVYQAISDIQFLGMQYRQDIGARGEYRE